MFFFFFFLFVFPGSPFLSRHHQRLSFAIDEIKTLRLVKRMTLSTMFVLPNGYYMRYSATRHNENDVWEL